MVRMMVSASGGTGCTWTSTQRTTNSSSASSLRVMPEPANASRTRWAVPRSIPAAVRAPYARCAVSRRVMGESLSWQVRLECFRLVSHRSYRAGSRADRPALLRDCDPVVRSRGFVSIGPLGQTDAAETLGVQSSVAATFGDRRCLRLRSDTTCERGQAVVGEDKSVGASSSPQKERRYEVCSCWPGMSDRRVLRRVQ